MVYTFFVLHLFRGRIHVVFLNFDFLHCICVQLKHEMNLFYRAGRESYGDNALGFVQVKREGVVCTVKAKVTPEHKIRGSGYKVKAVIDEDEEKVLSVECEDCAASAGEHSCDLVPIVIQI